MSSARADCLDLPLAGALAGADVAGPADASSPGPNGDSREIRERHGYREYDDPASGEPGAAAESDEWGCLADAAPSRAGRNW